MYSLGIIFFELVYPLKGAMMRAKCLGALRQHVKFPPGFDSNHPTEHNIIKSLLQHNPKARPSPEELLEGDLLPTQLDQEILKEAMRTIAIPNTTIFTLLMDKLFSIEPDKEVDYTYDYNANDIGFSHEMYSILTNVIESAASKLKLHGAIDVEPPLLLPKTDKLEKNVFLLDQAGTRVALPYDHTYTFARYVAQQNITNLKRYYFGRVYRKNVVGGQPKKLIECDFDIVGSRSLTNVHDAEVLRVTMEVLSEYNSQLGPFYVKVCLFQ